MAQVLIVEDNEHNLDLMTYLLKTSGHQVVSAMTATEGIRVASTARPDVIVLDIHLPDGNGFDVLETLRADADVPRVAIVAVTANAMVGDRDRILSAGFDGYLAKPIEPATFVRSIDAFLPAELRGHDPVPDWQTS